MIMKTQTHRLLDDRIAILDKNAVDTSPTRQVSKTASVILTLIRVSALVPHLSVDSHWLLNQDKMADNKGSLQLSECCFDACMALETAIQGKSVDNLEGSVRIGLKDLERYLD